jgi:reversibly glycosylated polypeptide/UDP-arabinopyranose mutase
MNIFIVIPTIRSLNFLKEWKDQFHNCYLIIVEDHEKVQIEKPITSCLGVYHYAWSDIKNDFGQQEWIFSRKNAGIRSYGFWKAYTLKADIIVTLDDDCYPVDKKFIEGHITNLSRRAPIGWTTTYPHPDFMFTRGIPYGIRDQLSTVISHGLWTNKIDLDGKTEIQHPGINLPPYPPIAQFIPKGVYFPMCSMNLAFKREVTPLMYFPLMGFDPEGNYWGYDRFDDIWAGIFAKKIIDHLGFAVVNGSPFVEHRKASDVRNNIIKEKSGMIINEKLWRAVDAVSLTKNTPSACYRELAEKIIFPNTEYFKKLRMAMINWSTLF